MDNNKIQLNKVVLITGGTRGIGKAMSFAFYMAGYTVVATYVKDEISARNLSTEYPGIYTFKCDVKNSNEVNALVDEITNTIGPVYCLINNAGISEDRLITDVSDLQWKEMMDVHVNGAFYCSKAVIPTMVNNKAGCIINISSMWGQVGASCEVCYSATKGAVLAMTKALAQELGPSHIRVNAVAPGLITTDMTANLTHETLDALHEATPLGCSGTSEDVAKAMVYLAEAQFVTGQVLAVNGGFVIT